MGTQRTDPLSRLLDAEAPPNDSDSSDIAGASVVMDKSTTSRVARTSLEPDYDAAPSAVDSASAVGDRRDGSSTGSAPSDRQADVASETDDRLMTIAPSIERARAFAERWSAPYRPEIFRVALAHLLGSIENARGTIAGIGSGHHLHPSSAGEPRLAGLGPTAAPLPSLAPADKLALALGVDVTAVDRAVQFPSDGKIIILGRFEGRAKKDLQRKYALAYLYVKEMALAVRMVDIEELRLLCISQGCYDQGNFTANYKADVEAGLLREQGEKGARSRRYMLSQKGVGVAADLLRELVSQ